jgi:hypothetical protein
MRFLVTLLTIFTLLAANWSCKTSKSTTTKAPESPYTDTIKVAVSYQTDSVQVFVRKIIVNDSLFSAVDEDEDYSIVSTEQKDSILFITLSSYNACQKTDFVLYQSSVVLKSYPPRLRCRVGRLTAKNCEEKRAAYTLAVDIREILKNYSEVNIMFSGSQQTATLKQYK